MDLNYKTVNIFPSIIHQFDVNGFEEIQDDLINYVYQYRNTFPKSESISNRGGWQSPSFIVANENDKLENFLINCLSEFPPIKKSVQMKIDCWININSPSSFNVKHNHPNCDLSGVLWIKCPNNSGNINFSNPSDFQSYNQVESYTNEFKNLYNFYHSCSFKPKTGRFIVFPSHLEHDVDVNNSNEDRISISFNIQLQ